MRILHVVALAGGSFGGPTTVALAQLSELARRGHRVRLTAMGTPDVTELEGIPVTLFRERVLIPGRGVLGRLDPAMMTWLWRGAPTADVVHIHTGRDLVSLAALAICQLRRVPYIAQTHGMVMPRSSFVARLFDAFLRPMLARAEMVFVLTDAEERGVASIAPRARLARLPNGIALADLVSRERGEPLTVLFLARLHPRKRVEAFCEMAAELAHTGWRFDIAGPDEGSLASLTDRLAERPVARYLGGFEHEQSLAALAAADVYVLPSVDEPFPMTVLEALAAGTPVVCTDSCGLADLLAGRRGARVTDGSPAALGAAVRSLLADWPAESAAARQTAAELFGIDTVADQLLAVYERSFPRRS